TDNCPGFTFSLLQGLPSGSLFALGTTTVEYQIEDDMGNTDVCEFDVTVVDQEDPIITTCPADRDIPTSSNGTDDCTGAVPNLIPEVVAQDNCTPSGSLIVTQSPV
ncbi:MAG: HYR domain-containing protein, partial [Saprospiraceae bacterium]|nr:HYR domain-containing protein [Saprospiraceae bacterium]